MKIPVQITFRNMDESPAIVDKIRLQTRRLERFFDSIIGCRVIVEAPPRHHHQGAPFHVAIELQVPQRRIVVSHDRKKYGAHEDAYVAVRDAFGAVRRQLHDYVRELRGQVKFHESQRAMAFSL